MVLRPLPRISKSIKRRRGSRSSHLSTPLALSELVASYRLVFSSPHCLLILARSSLSHISLMAPTRSNTTAIRESRVFTESGPRGVALAKRQGQALNGTTRRKASSSMTPITAVSFNEYRPSNELEEIEEFDNSDHENEVEDEAENDEDSQSQSDAKLVPFLTFFLLNSLMLLPRSVPYADMMSRIKKLGRNLTRFVCPLYTPKELIRVARQCVEDETLMRDPE